MRKKFILLMSLVAMLAMAPVGLQAQQAFITDVVVVGADDDDDADWYYDNYEGAGWIGKVRDLNDGAGGHYIHLMYKTNYSPQNSGTAINDFYLRVSDSPGAPAWLTHLGRTYYKVGADGDSQFINSGGDLNCGAGGYYIHLYYTKEGNSPVRCSSISYSASPYSPCNAVGMNGSTTAADLNLGAGGDDIFMHVTKYLAGSPAEIYTEGQLHDAVAITGIHPELRMMSDINLSKGLVIGDSDHGRSATVTLDLNGHTLNRGLTSATQLGSVIRVEPFSTLYLSNGTITGGHTQQSGGGICNHGTLSVSQCTITGCSANSYGGGIVNGKLSSYNYGSSEVKTYLLYTTITNCQSTSGGGLGVIDYAGDGLSTAFVTGCTFSNNVANNEGGGAISFAHIELTNCAFTDNTALDVGGFYNAANGTAEVTSCSFTNNIGTNGAGALANASNADALYLTNNTITGNTAGTRGAGIWNGGTINMSGSHTITGNTAAGNGGGIYNGGTLNVAGGTLVVNGNTKGSDPNNLFLDSGTPINVTGAFNAASVIHVSAANLTAPLTSGYSTHHPGVDPDTLFTADNGRDITLINNEVFQTTTTNITAADYSQLLVALNNSEYNLINITLTNDITMSAGLTIQNNKIVTIDLNGHTINCSNHDHAFTVNSGNQLTIIDGSVGQTGTITGATGGAIVNNGTFTLNAGTFTGNSTTGHGAALWNGSGATTTLNGGSITSNTASGNSAAIWNDGYLTMNSGSVTGNTASYGGIYDGGMLYVQGNVAITGNTTDGSTPRNVWLPTGKTINVVGAFTTGASIGFYPENPSQAMTTGYGTHNGSTDPDDIFTADNGYNPSFINNEVYIVNIITVSTESELMAAVQTNAIITLANNIRTNNPINITDNRYVTIDLQGDTIDRGKFYATSVGSCVFSISSGCTLTILDSSDDPSTPEYDGTGVIMGGYPLSSSNDGGGVSNHGTFILDGGTITKNKTEYKAAAIFNDGTVYLNRGIICQNGVRIENPAFNFGGAIYNGGTLYIRDGVRIEDHEIRAYGGGIYNVGTLEMTGGCIKDNKYGYGGGGIWNAATGTCTISGNTVISGNEAQSGGAIYNEGSLNITGGSIIDNKATVNNGGGIFNNGTINITGGYITGNTSYESGNGGGIWNGGTLNMQGNPVISGNTRTNHGDNDLYLANTDHYITVTGAFTEGAHISLLSETPTAVLASDYSTYNQGTDPNQIFVSDSGYYMKLNNDGNVIQNVPIGKWTDNGNYSNSFSHEGDWTIWIHNEAELARLARFWDQYTYSCCNIILEADLDMSAHEWTPLGAGGTAFMGSFEGNGHTINGIYVNTEGNGGLFSIVQGKRGWSYGCCSFGTNGGCDYIRHVTLTNAFIKGSVDVGGIAGYVYWETTIEDCAVEGTIKGGSSTGGIVGLALGESYYSGSMYNIPYIRNCLFLDGTITSTGNRATILGTKANNYVDCSRSYYVNPASATGNSSDVRAYPVTKDIPEGIVISYNTSSQGVIHHDTLYYPAGTLHFNVTNDLSLNVTSVQVNGTEIGTTWGDYSLTIDPSTAEAYKIKVITEPSSYAGQGTEANPYEIATTEQWNSIVNQLSSNGAINNYSGQYFKLMADITIDQRMGTYDHPFCGNFDGNGKTLTLAFGTSENYSDQECAPFYRINNATIRNLTVAGSIYSSAQHNAGIAARAMGNNNHIQNCVSNVSIHSNRSGSGDAGDCTNGGFIGILNIGGTHVYFDGCAFTGELLGANATNWGGFVGWRDFSHSASYVHFTNCFFAPTTVNIAGGGNSHTFCRSTNNTSSGADYNNCYYTTALPYVGGSMQAYSITPGENVTVTNTATAVATYSVSGITAYNTGFKRNDVLYAGNGQSLSLNLTGDTYGHGYIASAGSLSGTANPYTLTMAGSNTVISAWVPTQPTTIATIVDWNNFCYSFNYFDNGYEGVTVNLTADVGPVSTMAGTATHPFKGTFNGNGHTLTIAFGSEDAYYSEECAPFFRIQNATIENLVIEGSIYGAAMHNGGLVNEAFGNGNLIRNCVSRVSLHSNRGNDCSNAGFVGELNSNGSLVTFQGCAFTGEMVGPGARNWGGFVGWRYWETNNHNSVSFANCLCAPTTVEIDVETSGSNSRVFSRSTDNTTEGATYTNCYYTRNIQEADGGKQARSITSVARVTVANAGTPSSTTTLGVVGYGTGIKFENVNYAANEENVSLNLSYTGTHTDMVQGFSASNGTLTGTENPYTLTLDKNKNVVIYVLMKKNLGANMWYAIASPMHNNGDNETVAGVTNLTTGSYDLMRYNEADGKWESQKSGEGHTGFSTLDQGRGYIYRNSVQTVLTFNGEPNSGAIDASITASCADNTIKGFNLVGNPYSTDYAPTVDFYTLNIDGTWRANTHGSSTKVGIAEAFMIHVNAAGTYAFTEPSGAKGAPETLTALAFTVSNEEYSDVAYVRFDGEEGLPKISHLNAEAPMLYVPTAEGRYAIATLEEGTERFPLGFNGYGEYTLTVDNSDGFGYLHLLDRATGADIDLLRQPSYTFRANGSGSDRFTVLLSPSMEENDNARFAYWEGHNVVVEGDGELQVFDVMGRELFRREVSTELRILDSQFPGTGVYVMRLNGKSQKVVIK